MQGPVDGSSGFVVKAILGSRKYLVAVFYSEFDAQITTPLLTITSFYSELSFVGRLDQADLFTSTVLS